MKNLNSQFEFQRNARQKQKNLRSYRWQRSHKFLIIVVVIFLTSSIGLRLAQAAAGALDATFGTGGIVTTTFGDGARGVAVAVQPDGKIVVAGSTFNMSPTPPLNFEDFALVRYNSDGSLDTNFGVSGRVSTDFGGNLDRANGVAIQSDGKIVAVGETATFSGAPSFAVTRYNSNGTLDTSFDTDGKLTTDFGGESRAKAVVVQTNGSIVVAGIASNGMASGFGLARYNIDGSPDTSFDDDGKLITLDSGGASAVILQPDEKIIAAGYGSGGGNDTDFTLIRYNSNGGLDTTFDTDGKVTTDFSGGDDDEAFAIALQSDGKIVAAGYAVMQTGDSAIARYNPNGSLDSTFDTDGKLIFDMGFGDEARAVLIQRNGKILTAGYFKTNGLDGDFALARFNNNGSFDTSFDTDGKVFTDFSGNNKAFAAALQADGKIVAIGEYGNVFSMGGIAVTRYLTATNKPADFDGDGKSDVSVFRPSNGAWYFLRSSNSSFGAEAFGTNGDRIAPGDYDGDGITDFAVFRPADGTWYLLRSSNSSFAAQPFGVSTDLPAPADYDGDGKTDIAVFRPSNGTWYITQSSNGAFRAEAFGTNGDVPVPADYDGDGRSDVAVFRPSNGTWYLLQSTAGLSGQAFGQNEDKPVQGDYDADGKSDLAVFRPSNGTWYLLQSTAGFSAQAFGLSSDVPSPGDFDGDNKTDIAVFRPSTGTWYLQQSTAGFSAVQFGANGDVPVPSAYGP